MGDEWPQGWTPGHEETYQRARGYKPTLEDICRHEAGHAVARLVLGLPLIRVQIGGDLGHDEGAKILGHTFGTAEPVNALKAAVSVWAGPIAEGCIYGAICDLDMLTSLDRRYITARDPDSPHFFASKLLLANVSALRDLAALLVEHRQMTFERIRDSIRLNHQWLP